MSEESGDRVIGPSGEVDTTNLQLVSLRGDHIVILMPRVRMSKREALVHAAWIVALASADENNFLEIWRAVANT